MTKHFCDICRKERRITPVDLPTLNQDGVSDHDKCNIICSKQQLRSRQFDLCDKCLSDIAMYIYRMTK